MKRPIMGYKEDRQALSCQALISHAIALSGMPGIIDFQVLEC